MDDLTGNNYAGNDLRLSGIGGWLAFFAINLVLSTILTLANILQYNISLFEDGSLPAMFEFNKVIFSILLFEAVSGILFFIFMAFICILFFKKSRSFPKLMFNYMIANCVVILIDSLLIVQFVKPVFDVTAPNMIQPVLYLAIWGTYLKKSKRVRNTFVY